VISQLFALLAVGLSSQTPTRDPLDAVKLVETTSRGARIEHVLSKERRVFVEIGSALHIAIDSATAASVGLKKASVHVVATGPRSLKPPSTLDTADMLWAANRGWLAGTEFSVDIPHHGIKDGDELELSVAICPDLDTPCATDSKQSLESFRQVPIYVSVRNFGLIHKETEAFLFVRSAHAKNWDARPAFSSGVGVRLRPGKGADLQNFFSPKLGGTVALLDFDKDGTLEFGVGPTVTLFDGALIYGVGWNLMTGYRQTRYTFFGVSFSGLKEFIERYTKNDGKGHYVAQ
jgi:hypothetical protein